MSEKPQMEHNTWCLKHAEQIGEDPDAFCICELVDDIITDERARALVRFVRNMQVFDEFKRDLRGKVMEVRPTMTTKWGPKGTEDALLWRSDVLDALFKEASDE